MLQLSLNHLQLHGPGRDSTISCWQKFQLEKDQKLPENVLAKGLTQATARVQCFYLGPCHMIAV